MSNRQKQNSRCFIPFSHIQFQVQQAARERFPEFSGNTNTRLGHRTLSRLADTLATFCGLGVHGVVTATQKFIGGRIGKSDRALRDDIRDLEALGLLETIQNYDKSNLRVHNTYRIAPVVWLWRKGKQLAKQATTAAVAIAEGLTSRMVRRMVALHDSYREAACSNLKRGANSIERKIPAELPASSSKKNENPDKQHPADASPALIAQVVKFVRTLGFDAAAKILHSIPKKQLRSLYEANKHIDAAA